MQRRSGTGTHWQKRTGTGTGPSGTSTGPSGTGTSLSGIGTGPSGTSTDAPNNPSFAYFASLSPIFVHRLFKDLNK